MPSNRRILLVKRPVGMISDDCFTMTPDAVPEPVDGEAVVAVEYLSLDPAMRGWMRDEPSYMPPMQLGDVVRSAGVGRVVASRTEAFPVGATVLGLLGWQDYAVVGGTTGALAQRLPDDMDLLDAVSVYGTTGLTAYFGVVDIARPVPGETVLVSGAAGGVGSVAGQIGKILGCRVVGVAGSAEKCAWVVDELGFDACIDYKRDDLHEALAKTCPAGVDVYFDNVGGTILEATLLHMNLHGRIAACGMISRYNEIDSEPGPRNLSRIVGQRLRMEGFLLFDYFARFGEAASRLAEWVAEGRLHNRVHVVDGLLEAPRAINMLFTGENIGKLVVKV